MSTSYGAVSTCFFSLTHAVIQATATTLTSVGKGPGTLSWRRMVEGAVVVSSQTTWVTPAGKVTAAAAFWKRGGTFFGAGTTVPPPLVRAALAGTARPVVKHRHAVTPWNGFVSAAAIFPVVVVGLVREGRG